MYDSVYMKSQNLQNQSLVTEIRTVGAHGGGFAWRGSEGTFWGDEESTS